MKKVNRSCEHNTVQMFQEQLSQLTSSLSQQLPDEQLAAATALVAVLKSNTIPGKLIDLSSEQLSEVVSKVFLVMQQRAASTALKYLDLPGQDSGLLVCNCVDAPYLLDSLLLSLNRQRIEWQIIAHLCLKVERQSGQIMQISDALLERADESLMMVQVGNHVNYAQLLPALEQTLNEVLKLDKDQGALQQRLADLYPLVEAAGQGEFWKWLGDGNFTALKYRQLILHGEGAQCRIEAVARQALGLSDDTQGCFSLPAQLLEHCDPETRLCLSRRSDFMVVETNIISPVWRNEACTAIYLREVLADGQVLEHVLLGLYTVSAQCDSALKIPFLKDKIYQALQRLNISSCTYNYRKIEELMITFPKPELFTMTVEQLEEIINSLLVFNHTSVSVVPIDYELSSLSLLIIVPRSLSLNADFSVLENHLRSYFFAQSLTTRVLQFGSDHYILQVNINSNRELQELDLEALSSTLTALLQSWEQKLRLLLTREFGAERGLALWHRYHQAFCSEYRARVHPRFCVRDIQKLETFQASGNEQVELWGPVNGPKISCRLQFYSNQQSYLNELMPILVNFDLTIIDEVDFMLQVDGQELFIKSFGVLNEASGEQSLLSIKPRLLEALQALRNGRLENDYLNRLLVSTGLDWQQIDIFRGYRNYYFQLGSVFTKKTVAFALIHNPQSTLALYRYFEARFKPDPRWADPLVREEQALFPARMALIEALHDVENVNDDKILRTMFNLIDSTVRSNFYKRKNLDDYFFSFKISAIGIEEMPVPRPLYEIYVHNSTMEAIHLRGGLVARGGIRWSDRPDDFRTEVLGLMKTQMTKNAVIVPVGSKGGFIIKQPYSDREQGLALSRRAYQTLMRGLLDLTDNRLAGQVVAAADIVRYDELDPYLVVAADKGTAHLPDTANAISQEYNFWLGDGFASGGSKGYDHKALGITARGAWVCVQRHFREMGIDIQRETFTVVGIGDMSGDVFGNGMLLSDKICLLAAFNHRHIFIDPTPDPASTFAERRRLFALPRSSWSDFDSRLISAGGGVFDRDAKEIHLSPQIRNWLGIRHETLDGDSLIQLLLKAEVDLLWNGGIGTYVKASTQKNEEASDRANDALRINGNQLRAKVVGEGGNLGMTQLARVEYASLGGRINTDAIDNSAGVDCSDHEVNLKIFMKYLLDRGDVASAEERDQLLANVTDHVCEAVLDNNYAQSLCLSLDSLRNVQDRELFVDLASRLSAVGLLNRQSEGLPSTKELLARKQGYTRPELAILMAYSKMQLYQDLLSDDTLDDANTLPLLFHYFPQPIQQQFEQQLGQHPLRREIIATVLTNRVVNQAGATFCFRMARRYDIALGVVAVAHEHFSQIIGADQLRHQIFAQDSHMPSAQQYALLLEIEDCINTLCDWAFSHNPQLLQSDNQAMIQSALLGLNKHLSSILSGDQWLTFQQRCEALENAGLAAEVAMQLATLPALDSLLPLVSLIQETGGELHALALTLAEARSTFGIDILLEAIPKTPLRDRWDRMTQHLLITRCNRILFTLVKRVIQNHDGNLDVLLSTQRSNFQRYQRLLAQLQEQPAVNFHAYIVTVEQLQSMV